MSTPMPPSAPPPPPFYFGAPPSPQPGAPVPRSLEAGAGVSWIGEGWQVFKAAPGVWIAVALIFALLMVGVGLIPFVGWIATHALAPVLVGGMMLGCHGLARGEPLRLGHLFDGFASPRLSPLLIFGLINLGVWFVVLMLGFALFAGALGMDVLDAIGTSDMLDPDLDIQLAMRAGFAGLAAIGLTLIVAAVLSMFWWFAPALIVIDGLGPWQAMKTSFTGCLANAVPLLLYGLVMIVLAIAATIPMGLGWLVLGPVIIGSLYASWRQVFSRTT
jgi:uncharacterized membrane protein